MKYKILPVVRNDQKDTKGDAHVYIFISSKGKVIKKIPLGQKINPAHWDVTTPANDS